ncbi:MAG: hypothetical protein H0X43_13570 [Nitrosospira sp.]|nr:hypothetical protein [Nitrosospira sp.]
MHDLIQSIGDHSEVPATFDGEIPEFAFGAITQRIIIGQRYMVRDTDGVERPAEVTTAVVEETRKRASCGVTFEDGRSALCTIPLSDEELAAWRRHPDTFFGIVGQRYTHANTPLEMYDFFHNSFKQNSKVDLLKAMAGAPDFDQLVKLDQPKLASIRAERTTYGALAISKK